MARLRKINIRIKEKNDTGFSTQVSGRFVNKNGQANVKKTGIFFLEKLIYNLFSNIYNNSILNKKGIFYINYKCKIYN